LKDWLKNDPSLDKGLRDSIEPTVTADPSLRVAADLANGTKHRLLDRPREGAAVTYKEHRIRMGHPEPVQQNREITLADGRKLEARDLATDTIAAWDKLLAQLRQDPQ
jgi:hypothetical protein